MAWREISDYHGRQYRLGKLAEWYRIGRGIVGYSDSAATTGWDKIHRRR
ncbi:hypothetical protein XNC1_2360 [Xenorhabdus nematophila ATCC 19061]|uniref:Uncharacterized protein n=1 Tax=Xenorhabdus nematophila (strain ATCC 19061 / DSM 3370 / CCUG 14189 / LMG 1036 / NCIMB 9965 / AN6) TaxID=406817 RepID=D3VGI3_XENNA|nr:hypothetical protein XNC1_2360 [Xenorhabdus nematophila ATCC 19061]